MFTFLLGKIVHENLNEASSPFRFPQKTSLKKNWDKLLLTVRNRYFSIIPGWIKSCHNRNVVCETVSVVMIIYIIMSVAFYNKKIFLDI